MRYKDEKPVKEEAKPEVKVEKKKVVVADEPALPNQPIEVVFTKDKP